MKQAHLFIYGDVIGVGFRTWTERNAKELRLTGWVRNLDEGVYPEDIRLSSVEARSRRVEAVFEGEEERVKEMIKRCKKGPEVSWVEKVEVQWEETKGEFKGFEILLDT